MNLFSYFFYRSYKIYKKYKELPLFSSIIYMQVNMNLLLCPLNTFISSLFHGENKTPSSLMFGMLMIIEMYYIGKYYKRNGRKILKEYEKNDTSRFDSFFSYVRYMYTDTIYVIGLGTFNVPCRSFNAITSVKS